MTTFRRMNKSHLFGHEWKDHFLLVYSTWVQSAARYTKDSRDQHAERKDCALCWRCARFEYFHIFKSNQANFAKRFSNQIHFYVIIVPLNTCYSYTACVWADVDLCMAICICSHCNFPQVIWAGAYFILLIAGIRTIKPHSQVDAISFLICSSGNLRSRISSLLVLYAGPRVISDNDSYLYHYKAIPSRQAEENGFPCLDNVSISQSFRWSW